MEISDSEFKESQRLARLMERFLGEYTGDSAHLDEAWRAYKVAPHPRADTAPPARKVGFDVPEREPEREREHKPLPSVDELIKTTESLLKIHEALHGVPGNALTVPDRFKFRAKGDVYKQVLPGTVGTLALFPDPTPEERAETYRLEVEARVDAAVEAGKSGLLRLLERRRSEADRHRSVL